MWSHCLYAALRGFVRRQKDQPATEAALPQVGVDRSVQEKSVRAPIPSYIDETYQTRSQVRANVNEAALQNGSQVLLLVRAHATTNRSLTPLERNGGITR